jgi:hypothetical protein
LGCSVGLSEPIGSPCMNFDSLYRHCTTRRTIDPATERWLAHFDEGEHLVRKRRTQSVVAVSAILPMRRIITGQAILTPMVTGGVLAMSSSTDNVLPSPTSSVWKIPNPTIAGIVMGLFDQLFCVGTLAAGRYLLGLWPKQRLPQEIVALRLAGPAGGGTRHRGADSRQQGNANIFSGLGIIPRRIDVARAEWFEAGATP